LKSVMRISAVINPDDKAVIFTFAAHLKESCLAVVDVIAI